MKLEIQDAIQALVTPEQLAVILDTIDTLLEHDYILALDEINTVLMIADDDADSTMLVGRITDILTYALNYMLSNHGIVVSDDAPLGVRLAVVNTVFYIPIYIIPDDLAHIFQQNYDDVETLAYLVSFFSTYDNDTLLGHIETVSGDTLAYLRTSINERSLTMGVAIGERPPVERIKLINRMLRVVDRTKFSMMLELANAGVRIGRDYDELLHISFDGLESMNPSDAAAQLVGLAFFSNANVGQLWGKVNLTLDDYTDNPMERKLMVDEIADIRHKMGDLNV